ncbi:MAG: hypothetical protein QNJ90_15760 [Planctomycetota bacterium]|nr:hypothetical protein [Planctomycetota bacterium]
MSTDQPATVICSYRVKPGEGVAFEAFLAKHWPTLHAAGLTTDDPPRIYRSHAAGEGGDAGTLYVEIFTWKSAGASGLAHETPEIMAIWEPMGALCTTMEFPHVDAIDPIGGGA